MHSKTIHARAMARGSKAAMCLIADSVLAEVWPKVWPGSAPAFAQLNTGTPQVLSTGQTITPLAPGEARLSR